jgi:autoinducer 2-binding protein LuxP
MWRIMQGVKQVLCLVRAGVFGLVLLLVTTVVTAAGISDYWHYDEYYRQHPEQRPWLAELTEAVRQRAEPVETDLQARPLRIAMVYPSLQASSYWPDSERALQQRLNQLGIRYHLEARYTEPNIQLVEQVNQIRELLDWQPDYLLYTLDSSRQQSIIERLIQNTDTRLILQNITTPLKAWGDRQPHMYVGFDHAEGARLLADHFGKRFLQGADYGVLFRSQGLISQLRGMTYIQSVPESHRLRSSYYTDSSRVGGRKAALQMLREHPELDYIYACSTDVALGAVDALAELGRADVVVNGWGGSPAEIEQLRLGGLKAVLMRMNDDNAIAIAEAIKRDLEGKPQPLIYSSDFVVLDDSMSVEEIQAYEALARRYSAGGY